MVGGVGEREVQHEERGEEEGFGEGVVGAAGAEGGEGVAGMVAARRGGWRVGGGVAAARGVHEWVVGCGVVPGKGRGVDLDVRAYSFPDLDELMERRRAAVEIDGEVED